MHVCACVNECVDQWSSSLFGWALCFDFFSSSLRSNASPLSYAARTSLEGLQSLSPSTDETPPTPSPFLNSFLVLFPFLLPPLPCSSWLPVLMLVLSFVPHSSSCLNLMLRVSLGSIYCQYNQPYGEIHYLFPHMTCTLSVCALLGKQSFPWASQHSRTKSKISYDAQVITYPDVVDRYRNWWVDI